MREKSQIQLFAVCFLCSLVLFAADLSAKKRDVYPSMSRVEIQEVIDIASNHDTIIFHSGIYDFTDAPLLERTANTGALTINEKTLRIIGEPGNLIVGPDSENPLTWEAMGANAFSFVDLDFNNDINFEGLCIQNFMRGLSAGYTIGQPADPDIVLPGCRNITVQNCDFKDIHRDAVSCCDVQGNISIKRSSFSTIGRYAIILNWGDILDASFQPFNSFSHITENTIIDSSNGMFVSAGSNVHIRKNIIDAYVYGIKFVSSIKGRNIISNSISNCLIGIELSGIWWNDYEWPTENMNVSNNQLSNIKYFGIMIDGGICHDNVIKNNEINMSSPGYAGVYSEGDNNQFIDNVVTGSGYFSFWLSSGDYSSSGGLLVYAHDELIQGNVVKDFLAIASHYYLEEWTHDNKIIGSWEENICYTDLGYRNEIIGVYPCGSSTTSFQSSENLQSLKFNQSAIARGTRERIVK